MTSLPVAQDTVTQGEGKLGFAEKLAAGLQNGLSTFHGQVVQLFMLFFYTEALHVNPAYVAALLLAARIISAVATPVFGVMLDKIHLPWGKYKPWLIAIGLGLGVLGWLTFTDFHLGGAGTLIYITVTYVFYSIFMSVGAGAGAALVPAMTKRVDDRLSIGQLGFFCVMMGAVSAQIAVQPLTHLLGPEGGAAGYSRMMGLVLLLGVVVALVQHLFIRERHVEAKAEGEPHPPLKTMLQAVLGNKTALIVYLFGFSITLSSGVRNTMSLYYLKYYFHDESLVVISGLVSLLPMMVGVSLSGFLMRKIGVKGNLLLGAAATVLSMAAVFVLPPNRTGVVLFLVFTVTLSFFSGISSPAQGTLMPAAMDYTEWKTGMRINGFMGSLQGFMQALSNGLSGAIIGGALLVSGYVGGQEQTAGTLLGFRLMMSLLPAAIALLAFVVIRFDLTEEKQARITRELAQRKAESGAPVAQ